MTDLATWALICAAGFAGFVLSSTTGVGAALVLVPFLTAKLGAQSAVALLAPVLAANSLIKLFVFRQHIRREVAWLALAGGVPGAFLGALVTTRVPDVWLARILAAIIIGFVVQERAFGARALRVGTRGLLSLSFVTGVASGLTSAGGPTNAMALRAYGLSKEAFVATGAVVGIGLQIVKIPVYIAAGTLSAEHLNIVAMLAFTAAAAAFVGRRALVGLSEKGFGAGLHVALVLLALWMLL